MTNSPKTRPATKNTRSPRRRSREMAMQGMYQWLMHARTAHSIGNDIQQSEHYGKTDTEHFLNLLSGTIAQVESLQEQLAPLLDRPVTELSPIEHAILLVSTFEMANHPEIPYRVVINEAVELAKAYGGIDGHKFVNGVLDKLAVQLRPVEVNAARPS